MALVEYFFVTNLQDSFSNWFISRGDQNLLGLCSQVRKQCGRLRFFLFMFFTTPAANDDSVKMTLRLFHLSIKNILTDFVEDMSGGRRTVESPWTKLEQVVRFLISISNLVNDKSTGVKSAAQRHQWVGWISDICFGFSLQRTPKNVLIAFNAGLP